MIKFKSISKSFKEKKILNAISFEVLLHEIYFILGRSGTGKSVTLKHLVGLLEPDLGEIEVGDSTLKGSSPKSYFKIPADLCLFKSDLRRYCGIIFQQPALIDGLDVFQNIAFGLRGSFSDDAIIRATVLKATLDVGLDPKILSVMPETLSYGMKKRVSIARTLAPNPSILCFDEPTTGLDIENTRLISNLIVSLTRKLQKTCVVVSHDISEALRVADKILLLDEGKVIFQGTPSEFKDPVLQSIPLVQEFLKEVLP